MSDTGTMPLTEAEQARLSELLSKSGSGESLTADEAMEVQDLTWREQRAKPLDDEPPADGPQPLSIDERARLAELRAKPRMNDAEYEESLQLIERENIPAPEGKVVAAATDYHARLAAGINEPPPAAPPPPENEAPQHAMFTNLMAAVEHLIGAFGHLQATVPQAAGLASVISAAAQRLAAARYALMPPPREGPAPDRAIRLAPMTTGIPNYGFPPPRESLAPEPQGTIAASGTVVTPGTVSSAGSAGQPWPVDPQV